MLETSLFPKVIHQTYISEDKILSHWKESRIEWEKLHSSLPTLLPEEKGNYKFWSDEDNLLFVKENFPDFLETYINFPHNIQRADAIRYCILYQFGGIYSDLDIIPLSNIFKYFESGDIFLVKSGNVDTYTNSFMASRSHQKFWLECIEEMKKKVPPYIIGKHFTVMYSTGPMMLNRVVKKTRCNITTIPTFLFNAGDISDTKKGIIKEGAVLKYVQGGSWNSFDSKLLNFFYVWRNYFIGLLTVIVVSIFLFLTVCTILYFKNKSQIARAI